MSIISEIFEEERDILIKRIEELDERNNKLTQENYNLKEENVRLEKNIIRLGKILHEKKEMWDYFEARFVKVSDCNPEQKEKCPMFPDRCIGDRCSYYMDLAELLGLKLDKGDLR